MSTAQSVQPLDRKYMATSGSFRIHSPKLAGNRNPAELICSSDNKRTLIVKYDTSSTAWFSILITVVAILLAVVFVQTLGGSLGGVIGGVGAGTIVLSYRILLFLRQHEVKFDIAVASDAIADDKRRQMAFLLPFEKKMRWIVLEFGDNYSGASNCLRASMGEKLRSADIPSGRLVFLAILVIITILAVLLTIGYIVFFI